MEEALLSHHHHQQQQKQQQQKQLSALIITDEDSPWVSIRDYATKKLERAALSSESGWFSGLWPFMLDQEEDPVKLKRLVDTAQTVIDIDALYQAIDILAEGDKIDENVPIDVCGKDLERRLGVEIVEDIVKNAVCFKKFEAVVSIKLNRLKRRAGWHLKRRLDSLQPPAQKQEGVPAIVEPTTKDATLPAVVPPLGKEKGDDKEEPEVPLNGTSTCTVS